MDRYEDVIRDNKASLGETVLKQAGSMAAYIGLNMAFGAFGKVAASFGAKTASAAISSLAKRSDASKTVVSAALSLHKIKSPSLSDVVTSLGFKIPKVAPELKPIANWAKEQITALPAMMVIQNISAISDGRKLNAVELLKESVQADLLFRGSIKGLGTLSKGIKATKAYGKLSQMSWKPVQKFLEATDLNVSFFVKKLSQYEGNYTYRATDSRFNFNEINSKYGPGRVLRGMTNTIMATIDGLSTSMQSKMMSKQDEILGKMIVRAPKSLDKNIKDTIERTFVKSNINTRATNLKEYYNNSYKDIKSSATTLGNLVMKAFQFEGVPIVNLLSANNLIRDTNAGFTSAEVVGDMKSKAMIHIPLTSGAQLKGDTAEEVISNIFGSEVSSIIGKNKRVGKRVMDDLIQANQNMEMLKKGNITLAEGMIGVNTGSGMYIGFKPGATTPINFVRFGSMKAITGKDSDASKFMVGTVIQKGSQAHVARSKSVYGAAYEEVTNRDNIGFGSLNFEERSLDERLLDPTRGVDHASVDLLNSNQDTSVIFSRAHDHAFRSSGSHAKYAAEAKHIVARNKSLMNDPEIQQIQNLSADVDVFKQDFWDSNMFTSLNDRDKHIVRQLYDSGFEGSKTIGKQTINNLEYVQGVLYMNKLRKADLSLLSNADEVTQQYLVGLGFHTKMSDPDQYAEVMSAFVKRDAQGRVNIAPKDFLTKESLNNVAPNNYPQWFNNYSDYVSIGLSEEYVSGLAKETRVSTNALKWWSKNIENLDPDNMIDPRFFGMNDNTLHIAATGIAEGNKIVPIKLEDMGSDAFSSVYTVAKTFEDAAIMSVNDLANNFKLGKQLTGNETMGSYMSSILASNWTTLAGLGAATIASDLVFKSSIFAGSPLEDGVLPFVSGMYNSMKTFGAGVANYTGISKIAGAIESAVPGIISSPLGGTLLSVAPILMGLSSGLNSGSFSKLSQNVGLGIVGSAVLGGLGASILGDYDVTMGMDEAYAIASGTESVGVRKGRFWGLSAGSFWGQNIQYYRNSMAVNGIIGPTNTSDLDGDTAVQAAEMIGLVNPVARNRYSRPYLTSDNFGQGAGIAGVGGYASTGGVGSGSQIDLMTNASNLYGLRGFIAKDAILGNLNPDLTNTSHIPRIASAKSAYGMNRKFWNMNAGGFFGQTEYLRRILPKTGSSNEINPLRNLMPNWMPGEDYFINFKEGDPYTKIQEGEIRLPGSGHLSSNPVRLDLVYDLELMGRLTDEDTINYAVYGDPKNQEENLNGQMLRKQYLESAYETAGVQGIRITDNPTYYAGNNIIANADLEIRGTAIKIETVSNQQFLDASKEGGENLFQRKADLLSSISNKESEIVVMNSGNGQQKIFRGRANPGLLRSEISKLRKLQPKIVKKMRKEGRGVNNLYSIIDRFKVLADVAPYSKEYRNYERIIKRMAQNGELGDSDIKEAAKAMKKRETVVRGLVTADGKGSILSELLPSKVLSPNQIDPLVNYREQQIYSSGMKRWEQPWQYFQDDYALSASGKFNPIKRGIGSAILYNFVFGPQGAMVGGLGSASLALTASITGGKEIRDTYDTSRSVLLKQSALEYARNIHNENSSANTYNLYNSMISGNVDAERLSNSLSRTDRTYLEAFKNITDEDEQREILESVDPSMAHILSAHYGMDYSGDTESLQEASEYISNIPDESILYDTKVNTDYMVIRELDKLGIDPRNIGKNFDQEKYEMSQSYYNQLDFSNANVQSVEQSVQKKLSRVVKGKVSVTDFNIPGERNIHVVIVNA